ncbi:rhamnogalacturonan lyase [Paenibacillus hamazuiensis]|uniref:rhamnogalacturonan lyase n=1 Tax=Paenibacillus hamazuiensis TaxID=2936508 RepID=UPI00308454F2
MFKAFKGTLRKTGVAALTCLALAAPGLPAQPAASAAQTGGISAPLRQMEYLTRGPVAVKTDGGVFVSWRLLGTDPADIAFNVYRSGAKANAQPITSGTNFLDEAGSADSTYTVRAVVNGKEHPDSEAVSVWGANYLSVPLKKPDGGVTPDGVSYTYNANDASVGDVDGDGTYEIILKWDPSNSKDNSQDGYTGEVFVDAYKMDGTLLWRIAMGKNIRAGAHYTQFLVYDLDGDGKAEVAMKTADGTTDGTGKVIGDPAADYRNTKGRVLSGPEYLTIFEGATGKELATTQYDPPRGSITDWGDNYGNRVDRFLACIAYLDGQRPSLVMSRGYYTRTVLAAYNWRDRQLSQVWRFDSKDPGNSGYAGQGNHNLSVADVDGDGKDEIIFGGMTVDDNGKGLYTTGVGHGDALHVGDLNPDRPGLEVFKVMESSPYGAAVWDAGTGSIQWRANGTKDTGRGMSADIDPRYKGEEVWATSGVGLYSVDGTKISSTIPSVNFGIWWDGDLLRELLDDIRIDKWDYTNSKMVNLLTADGAASNNGTKATPSLQADLFGDWREEAVWRTADSSALRIYTTTAVTDTRIYTLMHDPVYRLGVAWQNIAYNQPPHPGFYIGDGMSAPPRPSIYVTMPASVDVQPDTLNLKSKGGKNSVTAYIGLPTDFNAADFSASTVSMSVYGGGTLPAQLSPVSAGEQDGNGANDIAVKFDREKLIEALAGQSGEVPLTVTGTLRSGQRFIGSDTVRVIH